MFLRTLWTEVLKLKRTLALAMIFIAPLVVVFLQFVVIFVRPEISAKMPHAWATAARGVTMLWAFLMMPLFITLESALIAGLEHNNGQWKNLLALPIPRPAIYLSKLIIAVAIMALSTIMFIGEFLAGGFLTRLVHPAWSFSEAIPWAEILGYQWRVFVPALLLVAIHHWFSLRFQNFTASIGFGMIAVVGTMIIVNSSTWGLKYPWSIPVRVMTEPHVGVLVGCVVAGLVVAGLGCWDFTRREIA